MYVMDVQHGVWSLTHSSKFLDYLHPLFATLSIQTQYCFLNPSLPPRLLLDKSLPGDQTLMKSQAQCPSAISKRHISYISKSSAQGLKVTSSACLISRSEALLTSPFQLQKNPWETYFWKTMLRRNKCLVKLIHAFISLTFFLMVQFRNMR